MEPQSKPSPEQAPLPAASSTEAIRPEIGESLEARAEDSVEAAPVAPERESNSQNSANQNQGMPTQLPPVQQVTLNTALPSDTQASPQVSDTPDQAADDEVLDKQWVGKTKEIVRQTRDDPRQQNEQVSHLKADYILKRYGKVIRLPEEKS